MSYNLFLLAFVLGMTGTFHYGLQVSIINSPAEVSMESSKSELPGIHCSRAFMPLYAVANFLFALSELDLSWFLGSKSSCYCSRV